MRAVLQFRASSGLRARLAALTQALEEMRIGNEWLDGQRKAWEAGSRALAYRVGTELRRAS